MEINDLGSADRLQRKRQSDAARAAAQPTTISNSASSADEAQVRGLDQQSITRLVDHLKTMNPVQAHRVEELRKQISDGAYSADPDALAEAFIAREDGR